MDVKKCALAGLSPQSLPFGFDEGDNLCIYLKQKIRTEIINLIEKENVTYYISGMAAGVAMYAAETVLDLKEKYPYISLECVLPCVTYSDKWQRELRKRYFCVISKCDKETLIQRYYSKNCMHKRDQYIVDQSNIVLAVWDGRPGGTSHIFQCALKQGRPVEVIHPKTLLVSYPNSRKFRKFSALK